MEVELCNSVTSLQGCTSLCACVRTHVFCVRQWSLGISTGSKTKQTLRTYKWAYKTCMLKMQTILSNTKQCYIRISLNIRKRVKDIISARTSSRFRVEVSEIWGLETWVYESWGFEVFDGSCPLWKCWMEFGLSREFGYQFNSFTIPAFLKNSFTETPNPKYINQEWSNKPAVQPTLFQASSSPKTSATSFCSSTSFLEICT
jgi:hypothetical protein